MTFRTFAACAVLLFAAACTPPAPKADTAKEASAETGCPDDGPRFPVTGVCTGRASNYFDPALAPAEAASLGADAKDCSWAVNETALGPDEAILYRALSCKGVTARLEYAGGAHSASLTLATSAFGANPGAELVRVFTADPADPQAALRGLIAAAPAAERARCEVQPAARADWPKDALVIGYKKAFASAVSDGVVHVCGPYGLDTGAQTYWRIQQGYAWFFTLGQDVAEIDPAAITLFRKGADGAWAPAE